MHSRPNEDGELPEHKTESLIPDEFSESGIHCSHLQGSSYSHAIDSLEIDEYLSQALLRSGALHSKVMALQPENEDRTLKRAISTTNKVLTVFYHT